jgi:SAM-dependent methyltransferase
MRIARRAAVGMSGTLEKPLATLEAGYRAPPMTDGTLPEWLASFLGLPELPTSGSGFEIDGKRYVLDAGVLRAEIVTSAEQAQTAETFGFKWHQLATFDGDVASRRHHTWMLERYGDVAAAGWWEEYGERPVLLDAGCGAAWSSLALFGERLRAVRFLGVDVSRAVDVALRRCAEQGVAGAFFQDDLASLPFRLGSVDVIFSEGVLHHTDSPAKTLERLATLLTPGGRFLFYVYRRKGPIREFTDDYIRAQLQEMSPEEAWKAVEPLTKLGVALGELGVEVEVPEDVGILEIPAGRYDIQRLFYWHVAKAFHHPDLSFDELNHINYDWYAPANAHRQTPEQVRTWCEVAGLEIEREHVEDAGITVVARRR